MTDKNLPEANSSADATLTRQEFIRKVLQGAALTGGVLVGPKVLDKFLVPKAYAQASLLCTLGGPTGASNQDTVIGGTGPCSQDVNCLTATLAPTCCVSNTDSTLIGCN